MAIELKPGDGPSCFNRGGLGAYAVAILTTDTLDATTVDPFSVTSDGAGVRVRGKSGDVGPLEDVNVRGAADLMVQIEDENGTYHEGNLVATLNGETVDGTPVQGTDTVCFVQ